jgi:hypothetical protein
MSVLPPTLAALLALCSLRFGRAGLARLAALRLRGGALACAACLLQIGGMLAPQYRLSILLLSAACLASFCWLNRRQHGIVLITAGVGLNMAVMAANGGYMPISPAALARRIDVQIAPGTLLPATKDIVLEDHEARLALLGDRLLLPGRLASLATWSIGDFVLIAGVGRLLWQTMKGTTHAQHPLWRGTALPRT